MRPSALQCRARPVAVGVELVLASLAFWRTVNAAMASRSARATDCDAPLDALALVMCTCVAHYQTSAQIRAHVCRMDIVADSADAADAEGYRGYCGYTAR